MVFIWIYVLDERSRHFLIIDWFLCGQRCSYFPWIVETRRFVMVYNTCYTNVICSQANISCISHYQAFQLHLRQAPELWSFFSVLLFVHSSVINKNPSTARNHHPSSFFIILDSSFILRLLSFSACFEGFPNLVLFLWQTQNFICCIITI